MFKHYLPNARFKVLPNTHRQTYRHTRTHTQARTKRAALDVAVI